MLFQSAPNQQFVCSVYSVFAKENKSPTRISQNIYFNSATVKKIILSHEENGYYWEQVQVSVGDLMEEISWHSAASKAFVKPDNRSLNSNPNENCFIQMNSGSI